MRKNPLLVAPPKPATGRLHRLGQRYTDEIRGVFGDLSEDFDDIHKGVFFSPSPVVAYTYAAERQDISENDYGLKDVVNPPVLIGIRSSGDEQIDTDALRVALQLLQSVIDYNPEGDPGDVDELEDDSFLEVQARARGYDLLEEGLTGVGGTVGNYPDLAEAADAVRRLYKLVQSEGEWDVKDPADFSEDVRQAALDEAKGLLPQVRLLREVDSDEVCEIRVVHALESAGNIATEYLGPNRVIPTESLDVYGSLDEGAIEAFDEFLLQNSTAVYETGDTPELWHGTSLKIAQKAFPDLITHEKFWEGVALGSSYDLEELQREMEEEEE
jgi:hypothetical protein